MDLSQEPEGWARESILAAGITLQRAGVIDVKTALDALIDNQVPLPTNQHAACNTVVPGKRSADPGPILRERRCAMIGAPTRFNDLHRW
jgi:hypothetical protein